MKIQNRTVQVGDIFVCYLNCYKNNVFFRKIVAVSCCCVEATRACETLDELKRTQIVFKFDNKECKNWELKFSSGQEHFNNFKDGLEIDYRYDCKTRNVTIHIEGVTDDIKKLKWIKELLEVV